jgi:hypothetical protein
MGDADNHPLRRRPRGRIPLVRAERAEATLRLGRWFDLHELCHSDLEVRGGETVTAAFNVPNIGSREGADVAQVYLTQAATSVCGCSHSSALP